MDQQERKAREGRTVRRLTVGAGAAALGLASYFTATAATASPLTFGMVPGTGAAPPAIGVDRFDEQAYLRDADHLSLRPPASRVRAATRAAPAGTVATLPPLPAARPPAPAAAPVATTGGSSPRK